MPNRLLLPSNVEHERRTANGWLTNIRTHFYGVLDCVHSFSFFFIHFLAVQVAVSLGLQGGSRSSRSN